MLHCEATKRQCYSSILRVVPEKKDLQANLPESCMTAIRTQMKVSGRLTFTVINEVIQLLPTLCRPSAPPPPGPAPPALSLPITLKHLKTQNPEETFGG